jgi:hypothetical protein
MAVMAVMRGWNAMPSPSELARNLISAFERRDWVLLESLYHRDARLPTEIGGREPLTPTELIAVLQSASGDALYDFDVGSLVDLDERTALGSGRLRLRRPTGGFADGPKHWVYVFRDDLLWRSGVYSTARKARQACATQGHSLGIAGPESGVGTIRSDPAPPANR